MFKTLIGTTVLLIVLAMPTMSRGESLDLTLECSDFSGLLNGSLDDLLGGGISIGGCTLGFSPSSSINTCANSILNHNLESQKALWKRDYTTQCGSYSNASNDVSQRMQNAYKNHVKPLSRDGYTRTKENTFYFSGGKSTLETMQAISTDASTRTYFGERNQELAYSYSLSTQTEQCKKTTALESMTCALKEATKGFNSTHSAEETYISDETNKVGANISLSSMPERTLILPSQTDKELLPLDKQRDFQNIAESSITYDTLMVSSLNKIKAHRIEMMNIVKNNNAASSVPVYENVTNENIEKREDKKLP